MARGVVLRRGLAEGRHDSSAGVRPRAPTASPAATPRATILPNDQPPTAIASTILDRLFATTATRIAHTALAGASP